MRVLARLVTRWHTEGAMLRARERRRRADQIASLVRVTELAREVSLWGRGDELIEEAADEIEQRVAKVAAELAGEGMQA